MSVCSDWCVSFVWSGATPEQSSLPLGRGDSWSSRSLERLLLLCGKQGWRAGWESGNQMDMASVPERMMCLSPNAESCRGAVLGVIGTLVWDAF